MIKVSKSTKKQIVANAKKMKAAAEKFIEYIKERENEA